MVPWGSLARGNLGQPGEGRNQWRDCQKGDSLKHAVCMASRSVGPLWLMSSTVALKSLQLSSASTLQPTMPCCPLRASGTVHPLRECSTAAQTHIWAQRLPELLHVAGCSTPNSLWQTRKLFLKTLVTSKVAPTASSDLSTQVILPNSWMPGTDGHSVAIEAVQVPSVSAISFLFC